MLANRINDGVFNAALDCPLVAVLPKCGLTARISIDDAEPFEALSAPRRDAENHSARWRFSICEV